VAAVSGIPRLPPDAHIRMDGPKIGWDKLSGGNAPEKLPHGRARVLVRAQRRPVV